MSVSAKVRGCVCRQTFFENWFLCHNSMPPHVRTFKSLFKRNETREGERERVRERERERERERRTGGSERRPRLVKHFLHHDQNLVFDNSWNRTRLEAVRHGADSTKAFTIVNYNAAAAEGGLHSTEVAFLLLTRVRLSALPRIFILMLLRFLTALLKTVNPFSTG